MGFSRQECWVGSQFIHPGVFPTQGSNPGLPNCRQILYCFLRGPYKKNLLKYCCVCSVGVTPWDPLDCSIPGSSVHGIFQARILEWVAFPTPGECSCVPIKLYLWTLKFGFHTIFNVREYNSIFSTSNTKINLKMQKAILGIWQQAVGLRSKSEEPVGRTHFHWGNLRRHFWSSSEVFPEHLHIEIHSIIKYFPFY